MLQHCTLTVSDLAHGLTGDGSTDNDNQGVLFDRKGTRVDVEGVFAERHTPARQAFPCATHGENKNLGDNITDREGRLYGRPVSTVTAR